MAKTLRQAFKEWSLAPRNGVLASRYRDAVNTVLLKDYGDVDLEQFTETLARRIMADARDRKVSQDYLTKAASTLVYLLSWGGDHGYCQRPSFDYSIAHFEEERLRRRRIRPMSVHGVGASDRPMSDEERAHAESQQAVTGQQDPAEALCLPVQEETPAVEEGPLVRDTGVLTQELGARRQGNINDNDMNSKGTQGRARKVCQLDPETLKVVNTFDSVKKAADTAGVRHLERAVSDRLLAGGYYWARPEDVDGFSPAPVKPAADKQRAGGKAAVPARRSVRDAAAKALDVFTDDELVEELDRRGWQGELSRRQVVIIGAKE